MTLTHLDQLEAEAIHILRDAIAQSRHPVMLFSAGKDSSVLLHLALKAFYPAKPPFPLLHVDTCWKFRAMYELRDRVSQEAGLEMIVHRNPEGERLGINPIEHGSALHTQVWKTDGLKQALDRHGFDLALAGARRDEERVRAKERIFSVRSAGHGWDPKRQRPELWTLYNGRIAAGESLRVFPLSNWTEIDIWSYIQAEGIEVANLYFAAPRPTVVREGALLVADDSRLLRDGERPEVRMVRFRTLGCFPLSAAIESAARTVPELIAELKAGGASERAGRLIDRDGAASMERKKREGYF
jgi:sulfate adenylyltransferase subunit 2